MTQVNFMPALDPKKGGPLGGVEGPTLPQGNVHHGGRLGARLAPGQRTLHGSEL